MGKYDSASKKIINLYHQAWAEWVLQPESGRERIRQEPPQTAAELESILAVFAS